MHDSCPIAIVGLGGVFPGAADLQAFSRNNRLSVDTTRAVPAGRWIVEPEEIYSPDFAVDRPYSKRGCFVEDFQFDPQGLDLDPRQLAELDPVYLMALHAGRQAWQEAIHAPVDRRRVGVYLAAIALPTESASAITREVLGHLFEQDLFDNDSSPYALKTSPHNARVTALPAALVARGLGLGGGSFTLDAACASSLYAVRLACDDLRSGRLDAVLAGGVSRPDCLYTQIGFSQLRALSPSGCCRPFDAKGDGLVVGEGAGVVVLKRLDDALAAGDRIYATIAGAGLSNDIAGSLLAADSEGQLRAMRAAYREANWRPSDVDYVECHGTGTPVGDAAELKSLRTLWGDDGWRVGQCAIGSVKSGIGHLLTAAGAAGLIRTVLAMNEGYLPPQAHFDQPLADSEMAGSAFRVLKEAEEWTRRDDQTPRRAAVSAFGFGGINAHLLIEEWSEAFTATRAKSGKSFDKDSNKKAPNVLGKVAIVGMGARVGSCASLRDFQELVLSGGMMCDPRPAARWLGADEMAGAKAPAAGAYVDAARVEVGEFRLPPNEIPEMLPQQLLMMQAAADALKDAGLADRVRRERAGVVVGLGLDLNTTNYHFRWALPRLARQWAEARGWRPSEAEFEQWVASLRDQAGPPLNAGRVQGALAGLVASRIAREFAFGGPSFTVSAEEVSGLRAMDIAVRALQTGQTDLMMVGAVDLPGDIRNVLCAQGYDPGRTDGAVGEGAAAVVLKRLVDAEADGDRVYAVIDGIEFSSGGPDEQNLRPAYQRSLAQACTAAGAKAESLTLLEVQGRGDERVDRVETEVCAELYKDINYGFPAVSATRLNVGHAGAAAGLLSAVKVALCLYQEMLAPAGDGGRWPEGFHLPRFAQSWVRDRICGPRRALVGAVTAEGECAHLVMTQGPEVPDSHQAERTQPLGARGTAVLAIDGADVRALLKELHQLERFVREHGSLPIEALARAWYAARPGRGRARLALTIVAGDAESLLSKIESSTRRLKDHPGERIAADGVFYAPQPLARKGELAFVFPGSGNHYLGMGRTLSAQWPEVLRGLDGESERLRSQTMPDRYIPWRADWSAGWEQAARQTINTDYLCMIMGQVAHSVAMSDLLRRLGVRPTAVIGYSLGETASLFAMRAWRDRDEMFRRMSSSPLFQSDLAGACNAARKAWGLSTDESVDWRVVVVNRPSRQVRRAVNRVRHAYLLISNAPQECVIGGRWEDVQRIIDELKCEAVTLNGTATVHCDVFKEAEAAYRNLHLLETTPPEEVRFYSAAWARAYKLDSDSAAASIVAQALRGFDYPATIERAYDDGVRIFVEPGPQASCSRMIDKILQDRPHLARSACIEGRDGVETVLSLIASLYAERAVTDLATLYGQPTCAAALQVVDEHRERRPCIEVPTGRHAPRVAWPVQAADGGRDGDVEVAPEDLPVDHKIEPTTEMPVYEPPANVPTPSPVIPPAPQPVFNDYTPQPIAPSGPAIAVGDAGEGLPGELVRTGSANSGAHDVYLRFSQSALDGMGQTVALAGQLATLLAQRQLPFAAAGLGRPVLTEMPQPTVSPPANIQATPALMARPVPQPAYPRELCMEFAIGKLVNVLGPEFAEVDGYPVRVRLPDEPLMLVDRIMSVQGEKGSLTHGVVVTEHDVTPGAWYLDCDRCPTSITVEAGQADLFLCSYLGIDLAVKGKRAYRLLDAAIEFHRGLPRSGEVIRYEIAIDRFVKQGDVYLFFFRFEGTINGEPVLTMRDGCAGFFTTEEIRASGGIVLTAEERAPAQGRLPGDWRPLVEMRRETYNEQQIEALRQGDLAGCFGDSFAGLALRNPPKLPVGRMRLVHRVAEIDPVGGRYGLGLIRAEADIHPDDWFLTCHFVDDMVMPGTLMYECCLHTLRIYLWRMGWVADQDGVAYEPVPGTWSKLRCRGPVTPQTRVVTYEVQIKELGYGPEPYAIADAFMYADGRMIVQMNDMSLKMTGLDREAVESHWRQDDQPTADIVPIGESQPLPDPRPGIFNTEHILAFAVGKPSEAFGEPYRVFDEQRRIARLPGPPYMLLDRITEIHTQAWQLKADGWIEGQYDIPPDAWYFAANRQASMPFAVLLEIALQPCGWLAAYLGSALTSETDLSFRNLGGTATLYEEIFPEAGTLTTRIRMTGVSQAGGMIIEEFDMQIWNAGRCLYDGHTSFGFFSAEALAQQVGVRGADKSAYQPTPQDIAAHKSIEWDALPPLTPDDGDIIPVDGAALPGRALLMIDRVELYAPDGGPYGLGFIRGTKEVDPDEWFFKAHFYQDPVCPGSLGLESFLQLLKMVALDRWGPEVCRGRRFTPIRLRRPHTWRYRGQVIPSNRQVVVEAVIKELSEQPVPTIVADGYLKVDDVYIYEMQDFGISLVAEE